jgi:hypothetical protein
VPTDAQGAYFAPSPPLQFLIDPYPEPEGASWLGADVATSIRVDDDRYLWIFGDSLLGSVSARCPGGETYCDRRVDREYEMIRNSVGVAERAEGGSFRRVVKYWPSDGGDPESFFASGREGEFLWPLSGVRAGGAVFVAANRHTPESGLAPVGNTMVRIANPDDDPEEWTITRRELPNFRSGSGPGPSLVWTMAMAHVGRHVYVFGQVGSAFDARTVLARFAVDDMNAPEWTPAPQYLMRDAQGGLAWSASFDVDRLYRLRGLPGTSETTVLHDPDVGWYSYQLEPLGFDVHLYTAPDLEGPWRDSGVVYRVPPPWSTTRTTSCPPPETRCLAYIVYAVKAHPELAPTGGRALSYNVNLGSGSLREAEDAAERVPGFYVPRMIVGPASRVPSLRSDVRETPSGPRTSAPAP